MIVDSVGFKVGSLPFRYLGVPISVNKLITTNCEKLIDEKMIGRIRVWSIRHIFFAGRRQLINSVLLSICVYYAQIFLISRGVVFILINAICRALLWTRTCNIPKPGYVNWDNVCRAKAMVVLVLDP